MSATEFLDYINRKTKPTRIEMEELYSHLNFYEEIIKNGKLTWELTKEGQKYEKIRKENIKKGKNNGNGRTRTKSKTK